MAQTWLKYNLLQPKKAQSLFIGYDAIGKVSCNLVVVEHSKSDYKIETKYSKLSLEEALEKLDRNLPIILTIDGKGIAHKKVVKRPNVSLFHIALPNAKEADFYVQQYDINDSAAYVSMARQDTIDKLLEVFHQKGLYVVVLNLGVFQLEVFANYFDSQADTIIQGTNINFSEGKIQSVIAAQENKAQDSFEIAGEAVHTSDIIPFASAVAFLAGFSCTTYTSHIPHLETEEYRYKKLFVVGGWAMLITFLSILLVNFMLYSHYNERLQETQTQLGQGEGILKKIAVLKQEIDTRKKLFSTGNLSGKSSFSMYSDRLGACMPPQITLVELKECPISGRTKDNAEMVFEKDKIEIKGLTSSSSFVNQWIKAIEKEQWVNKVDIGSYRMDKEANAGFFELTIQIVSQDVR